MDWNQVTKEIIYWGILVSMFFNCLTKEMKPFPIHWFHFPLQSMSTYICMWLSIWAYIFCTTDYENKQIQLAEQEKITLKLNSHIYMTTAEAKLAKWKNACGHRIFIIWIRRSKSDGSLNFCYKISTKKKVS